MKREKKFDERDGTRLDCLDGRKHGTVNGSLMRRLHPEETEEIADILRKDGVISVATDTVFGVCARMDSEQAQESLRHVKNRPLTKAFPIMCSNLEQIQSIAEVDERSRKIISAFMPGPLTVILKKKEEIPSFVNGGMETLAIRLAPYASFQEVLERLGAPVYMTSANQSGMPVCTSLDEIEEQCPLLDAMVEGQVTFGEASTILDCSSEELKVLRQGPLTLEEIEKAL